MHHQLRVGQALAILERLAAAICIHDGMKMHAKITSSSIGIQFVVADLSDSKRLVGSRGSHFGALYSLARLMLSETGKLVEFDQVQSLKKEELPSPAFVEKPNWEKSKLKVLFLDCAAACFPRSKIIVETNDKDSGSTYFEFYIDDRAADVEKFSLAIAYLAKPIGIKHGRRLRTEVKPLKKYAQAIPT